MGDVLLAGGGCRVEDGGGAGRETVVAVEEQGMEVRARTEGRVEPAGPEGVNAAPAHETEETGLRFSRVRPRCGEAHLAVGLVGEVLLGCPKRRDNTLVSI